MLLRFVLNSCCVNKTKIIYFFFGFLGIANSLKSQEIWTGGTFRLKINQRLNTEITQQLRFSDETFHYNSTFTEIGAKFKLLKSAGLKSNYRYVFAPDGNRQRFTGDVFYNLGADDKKFSSTLRLRYQTTFYSQLEKDKADYTRFNFVLNYNLAKSAQPYASAEVFYRLNNINDLRLMRLTFGLISKFTSELSFNTFYRIENEINVKYPERLHIVGMLFVYTMKYKKDDDVWDDIENNKEE